MCPLSLARVEREEHRAHTKKCAFLDAIVEQPVTIVAIKETVELAPAPFEPEPEPEPAAATEVVVEDAATGPEQVQGAQPGAVTSAPEIKAAAVSAPQEAAAGRPAAAEEDGAALSPVSRAACCRYLDALAAASALSWERLLGLQVCDDVDPSMTVEQYLRKLNETQVPLRCGGRGASACRAPSRVDPGRICVACRADSNVCFRL